MSAFCKIHIPQNSEVNYGWEHSVPSGAWQGFSIAPNYYAIAAPANNQRKGSTAGNEDNEYAYASKVPLTARSAEGYHFERWTDEAGIRVSYENPYTHTVKADTAVRAFFMADLYQVSLFAENGRIKSGGGNYFYHTQVRVEAEADAGYRFVKWTNATGNSVSDQNPYTFVVTGDAELTEVFEKNVGATQALPLLPEGEAGVYYVDGILHLVNLEGYSISVSTMKGERVLQFTADSDNAEYAAALPAGIYILNAAKWKEKYATRKFAVKK
ncbi:hypothetical protein Barb6XT_02847 [Bacteroidales bacterium Barb6XT]|nr:hypothetical protein Barb6XT_02847 [Bacteroidales bacterium Barb6XT]